MQGENHSAFFLAALKFGRAKGRRRERGGQGGGKGLRTSYMRLGCYVIHTSRGCLEEETADSTLLAF